MKKFNKTALFRVAVLGPLITRGRLAHGELTQIARQLAEKTYQHPNGQEVRLSPKTIERWYHNWLKANIDGLIPKGRQEARTSQLPENIQHALITAKQEQPSRSISQLLLLLQVQGIICPGQVSRSSAHRLLQQHGLSTRTPVDVEQKELRSFEVEHAGDVWYGDVMHGPRIYTPKGLKKTYLISLMDDASRLICHSAFYFAETTLAIEAVLKQALLKRGIPRTLVVDNGGPYRAHTLQWICAELQIHLIHCKPYSPQGKGKLERWHQTCRDQFLTEIELTRVRSLSDLNARLWVWVEKFYHTTPHSGLTPKITPLERWNNDLIWVTSLEALPKDIDDYFYYRAKRRVRKDGTIRWEGVFYEVPHGYAGQYIIIVFDPHKKQIKRIESEKGLDLGTAVVLDKQANYHRERQLARKTAVNPKGSKIIELAVDDLRQRAALPDLSEDDPCI